MAKAKAPLMGFKARGQLGKSIVFGEWRGVQYARSHTVPANPRTAEQMKTRDVFAFLNEYWRNAPLIAHEPWHEYARGKPLHGRNALLSFNVSALREATDLTDFVASPGVLSAPALAGLSVTAGASAGELVATATAPTLPAGWSLDRVVFIALRNQDPHGSMLEIVRALEDTTAPYSVTFTGLTSGEQYLVAAWGVYTRPDGKTAIGPSINAVGTPA